MENPKTKAIPGATLNRAALLRCKFHSIKRKFVGSSSMAMMRMPGYNLASQMETTPTLAPTSRTTSPWCSRSVLNPYASFCSSFSWLSMPNLPYVKAGMMDSQAALEDQSVD